MGRKRLEPTARHKQGHQRCQVRYYLEHRHLTGCGDLGYTRIPKILKLIRGVQGAGYTVTVTVRISAAAERLNFKIHKKVRILLIWVLS